MATPQEIFAKTYFVLNRKASLWAEVAVESISVDRNDNNKILVTVKPTDASEKNIEKTIGLDQLYPTRAALKISLETRHAAELDKINASIGG